MSALEEYRFANDAFGPEVRRHRDLADAAIAELEGELEQAKLHIKFLNDYHEARKIALEAIKRDRDHAEQSAEKAEAEVARWKNYNQQWNESQGEEFDAEAWMRLFDRQQERIKILERRVKVMYGALEQTINEVRAIQNDEEEPHAV